MFIFSVSAKILPVLLIFAGVRIAQERVGVCRREVVCKSVKEGPGGHNCAQECAGVAKVGVSRRAQDGAVCRSAQYFWSPSVTI